LKKAARPVIGTQTATVPEPYTISVAL